MLARYLAIRWLVYVLYIMIILSEELNNSRNDKLVGLNLNTVYYAL